MDHPLRDLYLPVPEDVERHEATERGLSQRKLAAQAGVDFDYLSKIELVH